MARMTVTKADFTGKVWAGYVDRCELCDTVLEPDNSKATPSTSVGLFVDGRLESAGMVWAVQCPSCHCHRGKGLGTGLGQPYLRVGTEWKQITIEAYTRLGGLEVLRSIISTETKPSKGPTPLTSPSPSPERGEDAEPERWDGMS